MSARSRTFVDTNVLVYAYDIDAGPKHDLARDVIRELWESRDGVLSTQVLQEFYVTVTRRLSKPLDPGSARAIIATYQAWPVKEIDVTDILSASLLAERYRLSFWDGLILVAARETGAWRLISEDFQAVRELEGVMVENPLEDSG